jgi:CBS domain containing-hemolysin-like protein
MTLLIVALLALIGASMLTMMMRALGLIGRIETKKLFEIRPGLFFIYFYIKRFFPRDKWDGLFFVTSITKHILRILYAGAACIYFDPLEVVSPLHGIGIVGGVIAVTLILELCGRLLTAMYPIAMLKCATPYASLCVALFSPISFLLLKVQRCIFSPKAKSASKVRETIIELAEESELAAILSPLDRKLITSLASFRDRIVKEIMVPRIDTCTLPASRSVQEAANAFIEEEYSRIPVYRDTVDEVIGVVLYKDILKFLYKALQDGKHDLLETPLSELMTPILYAPETKKISELLQEFRRRQIHIAIVVDEYGGTEGMVTIEDILEELVGEIADEYDAVDEERLYTANSKGGWNVDAKMNILDIEKELDIAMPHSPEYDTIGGYLFHKAGTIPETGWRLHHDNFDIEVVESNERTIETIWIIPK